MINGELFTTFPVPEAFLAAVDGVSFRDRVVFHEKIIAMYLEKTAKVFDKFLQPGIQISFVLVFPSKMTTIEHETDIDPVGDLLPAGNGHSLADGDRKTGDPGAA